jgi:hypothetical protein
MMHARVIFKGGTSLSKAHSLIDRFSEDIDLYVVTRFQADGQEPPASLRPHVLIELTRMGNPEPNAPHELRSLINECVIANHIPDAEFTEFEPATIDVLMPHRTLVEKLCALEHCSQSLSSRADALTHMARHFYGVYQLLGLSRSSNRWLRSRAVPGPSPPIM